MFKNAVMTLGKGAEKVLSPVFQGNAVHIGGNVGVVLIIAVNLSLIHIYRL